MKTKLLTALLLLSAFAQAFATKVPLTPEPSQYSGFDMTYDDAAKVYTFTMARNPLGNPARLKFPNLKEDLPDNITSLAFEYKTSNHVGLMHFRVYDEGKTSPKKTYEYTLNIHPADEWRTCTIDITDAMKYKLWKFGKAGRWQEMDFLSNYTLGSTLQIRNIRYDSGESGYYDTPLNPEAENIIEAENFNYGTGYSARQFEVPHHAPYVNPTGDLFPIYAWGGPDFNNQRGPLGLKKEFQDLWECGFNMTLGSAWTGVARACLFPDREVNGVYVDLFEGTGLKLLAKAGLRDNPSEILAIKDSPRLAGYHIRDEPHVKDLPEMAGWFDHARNTDGTNKIYYGNMHPLSSSAVELGAKDYQNLIDLYMCTVGPNFISYDMYPVRHHKVEDYIFLNPDWFENLEIIADKARHYKVPMWTFVQSCQSSHANQIDEQPKPTREYMSVCAFTGLAYGSQCLQYYMYAWEHSWEYNYQNACTDENGERTDTWYMAQAINREVQAQKFVFLGSELTMSGHTNPVTPSGCRRLTDDMLPEGVASVTTDGSGMCVTTLRNGKSLYLMVVNPDVNNAQGLTITTTANMHRVLTDGTITDLAAGTHNYTLKTGEYIIYQVNDNLPEHIAYYLRDDAIEKPEPAPGQGNTAYRNNIPGTDLRSHDAASNGHYLANMGDPQWQEFNISKYSDSTSGAISFDQAVENWGCWYNYSFFVDTEMDMDISISHSVPWSQYGLVASTGVEPGSKYMIENNNMLNWPKEYAASMVLELDNEPLIPANQPLRPAVPEVFSEDGAEFNRILADKSQWIPTQNPDGKASEILYFWPKAGGNNSFEPTVNTTPDYTNVRLTPGEHTLRVKSLCYPWHFDAIHITKPKTSGITDIEAETDNAPVEWYNLQGIRVNPETASPGLYLRRQGNKTQKIKL